MLISSLQNGRIKTIVRLNQRRERDEQRLTLVEGTREVARALQQGIIPQEAYLCPDLLSPETADTVAHLHHLSATAHLPLYEVTPAVFAKIAYREESGGLLLVVPYRQLNLTNLPLRPNPLFVVIEGAEKPGNLGAILRTADAAGIDGVIVSNTGESTDIHNPNVIRASLGTLFAVPVASAENPAILSWLRQHHIQIVVATPAAAEVYTAVNLTCPTAIIAGSEAYGLSPIWLTQSDIRVRIPMHGIADSLNLSISVALLLYEAVRQRQHPVTR